MIKSLFNEGKKSLEKSELCFFIETCGIEVQSCEKNIYPLFCGEVATSALEMAQSSGRLYWSAEEVDAKLKTIMVNIYHNIDNAAKKYGFEGNYVMGANIAGFIKVADAMLAQGVV